VLHSGYIIRPDSASVEAKPMTRVNIVMCVDYKNARSQSDLLSYDVGCRLNSLIALSESFRDAETEAILRQNKLLPRFGITKAELLAELREKERAAASLTGSFSGKRRRRKIKEGLIGVMPLGFVTAAKEKELEKALKDASKADDEIQATADNFHKIKVAELENDLQREAEELVKREVNGVYQFMVGVVFVALGVVLFIYTTAQAFRQKSICEDTFGACVWSKVEPKLCEPSPLLLDFIPPFLPSPPRYFADGFFADPGCAMDSEELKVIDASDCELDGSDRLWDQLPQIASLETLILSDNVGLDMLPDFVNAATFENMTRISINNTKVTTLSAEVLRKEGLWIDAPMGSTELTVDCSDSKVGIGGLPGLE
jgi:hypothetical protein